MEMRSNIFAACLDQDVVLLDTGNGEYLCLPGAAEAFQFFDARSPTIIDPDLARDAADLGLLGQGGEQDVRLRAVDRDLPTDFQHRASSRDHVDALAAYGALIRHYYGRPFPDLIAYAKRARLSTPPTGMTLALVDRIQAFRSLLPWAPFPGVCLYRSFFLLAFLRRAGLDATWVFGVRTWPFEAHCWLQFDEVVLDDRLEHVRRFTPIFTV